MKYVYSVFVAVFLIFGVVGVITSVTDSGSSRGGDGGGSPSSSLINGSSDCVGPDPYYGGAPDCAGDDAVDPDLYDDRASDAEAGWMQDEASDQLDHLCDKDYTPEACDP
jgi:hypothetical protein